MLLENKNAVIYGAGGSIGGGSIGGAVARAFASAGAKVFLSGRTQPPLDVVAKDIVAAGGSAETTIVDALDEQAVDDYINSVVKKTGSVDISFNAIDIDDAQGKPIADMTLGDFTRQVSIAMKTQFLTSRAAARQMIKQGSGVILSITATPAVKAYPLVGGFGPACSAIEGFSRNLAAELGPKGIRVVCMRSAGSPDSTAFIDAINAGAIQAIEHLINDTMLKRLPMVADIANTAVFLASDKSNGMTGTTVNITCGTTGD